VTRRLTPLVLTVTSVLLLALAVAARAQFADDPVADLEGVEVTEYPGAQVPLDLTFLDEQGKTVRLSDYIDGSKPVILTLNYYACPMLCTLQLNGLIAGLAKMEWTPGQEFEMVTVSINPNETPRLATFKKQAYIQEYGRPSAASGWHFLTGKEANIDALADPVGYGYKYVPETNQYAHAAVTYVLTPDGKISRYLYGIIYDPQTLRLSLVEAAEGEIGTSLDVVLLTCFHFDPNKGRYTLAAYNVMRAGAVMVMLGLGVSLGTYWTRERRRRHPPGEEESE
jgi:protein SCO1/2